VNRKKYFQIYYTYDIVYLSFPLNIRTTLYYELISIEEYSLFFCFYDFRFCTSLWLSNDNQEILLCFCFPVCQRFVWNINLSLCPFILLFHRVPLLWFFVLSSLVSLIMCVFIICPVQYAHLSFLFLADYSIN